MKRTVTVGIVCIVVNLIPRCAVGPVENAGGDDFPNMIATAGKSIAENLGQQWENPAEASTVQLSVIDSAAQTFSSLENVLGKKSAVHKRTACNDSTWFKLDLSNGYLAVFSRKCTDTTAKSDTIVIDVNGEDTVFVSLAGALVQTVAPYTVLHYRCEDLDGDSALYRVGAEQQQAYIVFTRQYSGGRIEIIEVGYDGGGDGNFLTEDDNAILFASATVTLGGDTISSMSVSDADGDGYIATGNAAGDSSIVDIFIQTGRSDEQPLPVSSATTSRMVIFAEDGTKNYAVRYGIADQFATRIVRWIIQTIHGDSTFYPGDTVEVIRSTQPLSGDSLDTDTLILRAILGDEPADSLDDALIGIFLHSKFLRGNDREVIFSCSLRTPLFTGQKPRDGTVHYKALYSDDTWIEANGSIDGDTISAEVTTSGGKRYAVTWDAEGTVLTVTVL
ncbi:MAG: hypothetical protein JW913_15015 [Chitinispirillaceae bacterium]|nr:hypothetical protein [Chitinispirillaceae bacterium]